MNPLDAAILHFGQAVGVFEDSTVVRHHNDAAVGFAGDVTQCFHDVKHFIPHQANVRMMAQVARQIGVAPDRLGSTIAEFGNSSAATIPFTLSMDSKTRHYAKGDIVLMTAAGAGLTGGAVVFRW